MKLLKKFVKKKKKDKNKKILTIQISLIVIYCFCNSSQFLESFCNNGKQSDNYPSVVWDTISCSNHWFLFSVEAKILNEVQHDWFRYGMNSFLLLAVYVMNQTGIYINTHFQKLHLWDLVSESSHVRESDHWRRVNAQNSYSFTDNRLCVNGTCTF